MNDIKHMTCFVAEDYEQALRESRPRASYELPDGRVLTLGDERFRCTEPLFQPRLAGLDASVGLHEKTFAAAMACDVDVRAMLLDNVIVVGGTSMFEGFSNRLKKELTTLAPFPVNVISVPGDGVRRIGSLFDLSSRRRCVCRRLAERKFSTWIGGSICASLTTFADMWMSKENYDELGPNGIHKLCW